MKKNNIHEVIRLLKSNGISLFLKNDQIQVKKRTANKISNELLGLMKSNKEELMTFLRRQKTQSTENVKTVSDYGLPATISNTALKDFLELPIHEDRVSNLYPLTPLQQGFLFHDLFEEKKGAYICQLYCDLKGEVSRKSFEKSWHYLMQKHTVLRTAIFGQHLDVPVQCVYDQVNLPIKEIDFSMLPEEDAEDAFKVFLKEDEQTGFSFDEAPLFRINLVHLGEGYTRFVFTNHHVLFDGWSVHNLMRSFYMYYTQLESGTALTELILDDFEGHIKHIANINTIEGLSYWKTYLSKLTSPSYLPFVNDGSQRNKLFGNKKISFTIDGNLKAYTKKHRITENTVLQGAWSYLLSKYTANETVAFGAVTSGRDLQEEGVESKIGLYMNTIPVCSTVNGDLKVADWLLELQQKHTIAREEYGDLSLSDIEALSNVKGTLFDTIVSFQNYIEDEENLSEFKGKLTMDRLKGDTNTNYVVTLNVYSSLDKLKIILQYNDKLVSDERIVKIKGHLETLIEDLLNEATYIKDLKYLTQEEEQELLTEFNATEIGYPIEESIVSLFEKQVLKRPDAVAIAYKSQQLTYRELDEKSNQLAHYLVEEGVVKETLVPICVERSPEMIVGILAILKSGGVYVPIDPKNPKSRIDFILEDCNANILITQQSVLDDKVEFQTKVNPLCIDTSRTIWGKMSKEALTLIIDPEQLAYIIYTSGTTGTPKGAMIEHRNVTRLFNNETPIFDFNETDIWTMFHSFNFDFSVWEMYGALFFGGKLVLVPEAITKDFNAFSDLLLKEKVTILNQTPSSFYALQEEVLSKTKNCSLRYVIFGGEALKPGVLSNWSKAYPSCKLINMYGITETTVHVTWKEIGEREITGNLSNIGRPIPTLGCYILDNQMKLLPKGVIGELYVEGEGLARGYLNRPELTNERFVSHPFEQGKRVYKTGDLAKINEEGELEYIGRKDDQVKIRGYRIELGEIENQLELVEEIQQSVVMALGNTTKQLVGYYSAKEVLDVDYLKSKLKSVLPEYMVPKLYVHMPKFPVTANGKVDKSNLPSPDNGIGQKEKYEVPRGVLEEKMVLLWQELLCIEKVGINDNFYDLGGDSIKAIQLASRSKTIGVHCQVKDIFVHQTIANIVAHSKNERSVIQEIGLLEGEVTLHPMQHYFFEKKYEAIHHYNQSILLKLSKNIDVEMLTVALSELVQYHDALRFQYYENEHTNLPKQIYGSSLPKVLVEEVSSLKDVSEVCAKFQADLNIYNGDLLRFVLLKTPKETFENRLFFAVHHLAVDGVSWRILVEDLTKLIEGNLLGNSIALPEKGTSYRQWTSQLNSHASSVALKGEYQYWKGILSHYTKVPTDFQYDGRTTYRDTKSVEVCLTPSKTRMLLHKVHSAYGTDINDILLSALARTLSDWVEAPKIVIALEGHGREALFENMDINRTVGWFTSVYPVSLDLENVDDIGAVIADTKDMLREIPNKGVGYHALRFLSDSEKIQSNLSMFYEDLTFNYLGSFDDGMSTEVESLGGLASEERGDNLGKENENPHKIIIDSMVIEGQFQMEWKYNAKCYKEETIEALADLYIIELKNVLSHCNQFFNQERELEEEESYEIALV